MYHAIVKRIARNAFEDLSDRKIDPLLERSAPDLQHTFAGDHALGGTRHSREAFRAWLERLFRLFPELTFTIDDVMATGPPWNTRLAIAWNDQGVAADGVSYENEGVHLLRLEWGRLLIPVLFLIFYVPTLLATLAVLNGTPATPPWYGNAVACVATLAGVVTDAPWRSLSG